MGISEYIDGYSAGVARVLANLVEQPALQTVSTSHREYAFDCAFAFHGESIGRQAECLSAAPPSSTSQKAATLAKRTRTRFQNALRASLNWPAPATAVERRRLELDFVDIGWEREVDPIANFLTCIDAVGEKR